MKDNLLNWSQIPAACANIGRDILCKVRDGGKAEDHFLTFRGCRYRIQFTPAIRGKYRDALCLFMGRDPAFPGRVQVTREGLSTNPLKRFGVALIELFTRRLEDDMDPEKERAVAGQGSFESRSVAICRMVYQGMHEYRRSMGNVVAPHQMSATTPAPVAAPVS